MPVRTGIEHATIQARYRPIADLARMAPELDAAGPPNGT
jgi:hypothetical protein